MPYLSYLPAVLVAAAAALAGLLLVSVLPIGRETGIARLMGPPLKLPQRKAKAERPKRDNTLIQRDLSRQEAIARRLTPPVVLRTLESAYVRAGRPATWTVSRLLVTKAATMVVGPLLVLLLAVAGQSPLIVALFAFMSGLIYFLPDLLLWSQGQKRDEAIQDELADTLDQMLIAVDAGLGFDQAMLRVAENGKGAIADELTRTLQDIQIGVSRRNAYRDLGNRTNVDDLRRFVRAILQADKHGISVSSVLRTQAGEMRVKRRQRAEEAAQKVPIKVLFPLMFCLMPVLMLAVLGPAVLTVIESLSGMGFGF